METLQGRTSIFGSLSLEENMFKEHTLKEKDVRRIFHQLHLFERLHVDKLPNDLLLQLFSAPLKRITFQYAPENNDIDLSTADIVPNDIHVNLQTDKFPTQFTLSFLHRVAQLGHLERLKIHRFGYDTFPVHVGRAFVDAVVANKNLRILEL